MSGKRQRAEPTQSETRNDRERPRDRRRNGDIGPIDGLGHCLARNESWSRSARAIPARGRNALGLRRRARFNAHTPTRATTTSNLPGFFQGTEMPNAGWWEAIWPNPAGVLAAVGLKPGMEAIDLCSGDGWFTLQVAKIARHVVAIDIDPDLLEVAGHRFTESGVTNCDFVAGDAYELAKLAPERADFIFLANAFHGVPDRPRLA